MHLMTVYALDPAAAVRYAREWAYARNPAFYDFDSLGGDCTNFISQCILASGAVMNYEKDVGWYYRSLSDRAAAWTGVEFFYRFMTRNRGEGPFGNEIEAKHIRSGDVILLGDDHRFYHTLLVISVRQGIPYVAAHSADAFDRPVYSYSFSRIRILRIAHARKRTAGSI